MPKSRPPAASTRSSQPVAQRRPGWPVKLLLTVWLSATLWALWQFSPGLQDQAAICRSARP